jgi:hypothetical protein
MIRMSGLLTLTPVEDSQVPAAQAELLSSPLLRAVLVWSLYAIPIVVAVRPVGVPLLDPDVWWHLRVGEWVIEHQSVTANDPFSLPGQAKSWVAYSWLYEVVLYGLHSAFGLAGIILYRVIFSLAIVAAVHALVCRVQRNFLIATALTGVATIALAALFSERPWLITILFSTITLHAILCLRQSGAPPRWVWLLPILYVLWANVHIQFVYGLFLLALGCAAPLVDGYLRRPRDETAASAWSRRWYQLVILAAACFLATFINPYHARIYGVVLEYASQPGAFQFVNELRALEFREPCDWIVLALTGGACWMLGKRRASAFEVMLLVSTAWFAFRARRDLWFVLLADLAILGSLRARVTEQSRNSLDKGQWAFVCLALAALTAVFAWGRDLSPAGLQRNVEKAFPVEAARMVAKEGYPGPLFNDFNWGGYFIWSLPHLPVSIDGRTNLHGDERILRFGRTWAGAPGWREDEDLANAGVVIAPVESPLVSLLLTDPRFERVHRDDLACVFVRRTGSR